MKDWILIAFAVAWIIGAFVWPSWRIWRLQRMRDQLSQGRKGPQRARAPVYKIDSRRRAVDEDLPGTLRRPKDGRD